MEKFNEKLSLIKPALQIITSQELIRYLPANTKILPLNTLLAH